jgi:hypothetical protein
MTTTARSVRGSGTAADILETWLKATPPTLASPTIPIHFKLSDVMCLIRTHLLRE